MAVWQVEHVVKNPGDDPTYPAGAQRNIATFHKNVTEGVYDNATVPRSVNSTLTCILGREAASTGGKVTWDDMIRANKRLTVDTTGLTG